MYIINVNLVSRVIIPSISILFLGCSSIAPRLDFKEPEAKKVSTKYENSLSCMGNMLEVYTDKSLYIQSQDILDATGVSQSTGGEIPYNITEMVRSAINKIGDRVIYVPYNPSFILNEMRMGSVFKRPLPQILLSGAITEYDRTLESAGSNLNLSTSFGGGDWVSDMGIDHKTSQTVSRITLDFNLISYKNMVMLPKMNAANSVVVLNGDTTDSLSFAIDGTGLGASGVIKKVQGRHAAVRLLVELSMLEIIGRHANIPYWKCVPNASSDNYLINKMKKYYTKLDKHARIKAFQELLPYYGYKNVKATGYMNKTTTRALEKVITSLDLSDKSKIDEILYTNIYFGIPTDDL